MGVGRGVGEWQEGVNGDALEVKREERIQRRVYLFYQLSWSLLCPFLSRVVSLFIN